MMALIERWVGRSGLVACLFKRETLGMPLLGLRSRSRSPMILITMMSLSLRGPLLVIIKLFLGSCKFTVCQFGEKFLAHFIVWCLSFSPFESMFDRKVLVGHCHKSHFHNFVLHFSKFLYCRRYEQNIAY